MLQLLQLLLGLVQGGTLSFHSQLKEGEEIYWDEEFIIYDSIVNTLQAEHIVPANGERHVYYKNTTAPLRCVMYISPEEASIALQMAGDGSLIVDWGDNSDLETITLSPTLQKYVHFFDNYTDERSIKLYGDFNLKTWDLSSINGLMMPTMPLVADEIILEYEQFMRITPCTSCKGQRLKPSSLAVTVSDKNIYENAQCDQRLHPDQFRAVCNPCSGNPGISVRDSLQRTGEIGRASCRERV